MKKITKIFSVFLVLALALQVGCSKNTKDSDVSSKTTSSDWPKKTIQIIVPYNAGGDTDIYARSAADKLKEKLGVNIVVVNTPGGSGLVASKQVMSAKPDGYTILFSHTASLVQEASGLANFSYSDDFKSGGTIAEDATYTMIAKKSKGWNNLEDVVKAAKENPVSYSVVFGSSSNYVGNLFENSSGIKLNMIDVGSSAADRTAAFLGDQVDLLVVNYMNIKDYIEKGDVVGLGIMSKDRVNNIDIPTFTEQGYDVVNTKQYEFRFPKDTDDSIINTFTHAVKEVSENEDFIADLAKFNAQAKYRNPEDTVKEDKIEVEKIKEVMQNK